MNNIKIFIKGYETTIKQPILIELKKDSLQKEKEQTMKYKGIKIHKNLKCSTWYTRIRINGKQKYISSKTQKECYNKLKLAYKDIEHTKSKESEQTTYTLKQWFNDWFELYKLGKVKQSTIDDYLKTIKYIPQNIWNKELNKIELNEIIKLLNNIKAERQKQKTYELLRTLYKRAVDNEKIDKDLMARLEKPQHTRENGKPLTKEQEQQFIESCKQCNYGDYFLICLYQGLRKGEGLAITDKNINFTNQTITINKSINANNQIDTTKNKHSIRTIPMFNNTATILEKYKNVKGRIFNICHKTQRIALENINKNLNFKIRTKDLRSTFITRCQELNIPEFIIQSWVGHRIGSKITSQVYTKYNQIDNTKYIDIINSKFNSDSTQTKKKT